MEKLYVIKIGGNIIDNPEALNKFLSDYASLNAKKILVHGGGKIATDISASLGIEAKMVDGRRITDLETLKIVTMVYGGLINKNIVASLQSKNCNALGLTGADANIIKSAKRPVKNGIDYGFVGDVENVNGEILSTFLNAGLNPILAPLSHDGNGNILNVNADTMASVTSVVLSKLFEVHLIYCFELRGVLENFEDKNSVISEITPSKYSDLKEKGIISKGMIPKLDNSFDAIFSGVTAVRICHADDLVNIINAGEPLGTVLRK
ncbi:MAG TPA: acetylglutamate kinase [Cytophagaceae bacterium]|jgi:acetylglutamate kinase|nr:acetylglutamate kinase [Cytophagaceae bacterium]